MTEVQNPESEFVINEVQNPDMEFLKFFDPITMSIHLKENQKPLGKKGKPGSFELVELDTKTLDRNYLELMTNQILSAIDDETLGNTEISKPGALVVQYRDYRIAITRPPFSELLEITIVHPIKQMSLEDYNLSEKLMSRLEKQAEGILISGAPGSGKSTLASGIANFFNRSGKIVKTFESPRDLQVDPGVTQYTRLDGSFENSADILLLVRPDYTIFDEVRRGYFKLTPEEWVRQHFIHYLHNEKNYPFGLMGVEKMIQYNSLKIRADIILYLSLIHI